MDRGALGRATLGCAALALLFGVDAAGAATRPVVVDSIGVALEAAASLDGKPIRHIEVVPHEVYDPHRSGARGAVYRAANTLHIRTRETTVRRQLLMAPGEPWSRARAAETARRLRSLPYLEPVLIQAVAAGESVDVRIETRDAWAFVPEFGLEQADGELFGSVAITDRNLLGFGKDLRAKYSEDPVKIERSIGYDDANVFGSWMRLKLGASDGSSGASHEAGLSLPFYAEDTPVSYGVSTDRTTSVAHLFENAVEAAQFDRRIEHVVVNWGRGRRTPSGILRIMPSFFLYDRRFGPTHLQPGADSAFVGGEENLRIRRVGVEARLWRPRFIVARDIERIGVVEDIDLGRSVRFVAGFAAEELGSTNNEGYLEFQADEGNDLGMGGLFKIRLNSSMRLVDGPEELAGTVDARWIGPLWADHTIVMAGWGVAGYKMPRDFQIVIGGLNGLRAYPVQEVAGTQTWRFNAEHRWVFARNTFDLVSLSTAAFYDAARAWGAGAAGAEWHQNVGFGLRVSLPGIGLTRVARIDLAWPISPDRGGGHEPVLTFGSGHAF